MNSEPPEDKTERLVRKIITGYFYKYVATLVSTLVLTFGVSILSAQSNYTHLSDRVEANSAAITELRGTNAQRTDREDRLYQQLRDLEVTAGRLKEQVIGLRADLEHVRAGRP